MGLNIDTSDSNPIGDALDTGALDFGQLGDASTIDAAGGDQPTGSTSLTPYKPTVSPSAPITAVGSSAGMGLSGLGSLFEGIGSSIGSVYRAVAPPSAPVTLPGRPGTYVYNPSTGQYMAAVAGQSSLGNALGSNQGLLLLAGAAVVLIILLKVK